MINLSGKVAIVTGSSRGIGHAIAETLAKAGAKVMISSRNAGDCDRVVTEFQALGYTVSGFAADVADTASAQQLVQKTIETWGDIHIVVNNAGIARDNLIMRMKESDWDTVMAVNLKSIFNVSQAAIRPMLKARGGRIINITSVVGQMGNPGQTNYAASKAGIIGFTKSLAREIASRNITVNAVAPGYITTEMTANLNDEAKKRLMDQIPLGRIGETTDVANLVLFLASDLASYITGQVYNVDGGLVMQG
ncbi:MAG: beta-ketoacyl-ACP reductase [Candidatus Marinimicrobia bacterium CG_4_10_14_0_2_um_filter_48_9]|nr:MAG: beta-ketoacyl-ACP reductase [Candidatus Marinimicrobia bacterium CG_4_10_14_0_2_um_filter_48_9]PJA52113.1 MAG: beta-ketoacyl-ACP reductase [Candidatus Marinimicrobia bacterium CG_4_9_14_3_um_filter_48_9]